PDRALQDPQERQPLAPRPSEDGLSAPPVARLSEEPRCRPLSGDHRKAGSAPLTTSSSPLVGEDSARLRAQVRGAGANASDLTQSPLIRHRALRADTFSHKGRRTTNEPPAIRAGGNSRNGIRCCAPTRPEEAPASGLELDVCLM